MPKRTLQGVVVSDKQDKTVIVRVERRFTHPVMKKTVRRSNKFHAHDEKNEFSIGDLVWIEEHKPISKLKRWAVIKGEKRAKSAYDYLAALGIPGERMKTISYGKSQPLDMGKDEAAWAKNRRDQFLIIEK